MESLQTVDRCDNCGATIGKLEKACVWQNHVVCQSCYDRLSGAQSPRTERAISAKSPVILTATAIFLVALGAMGAAGFFRLRQSSLLPAALQAAPPRPTITIHAAVQMKDFSQIKSNLYWGCDVNGRDDAGCCPIHLACLDAKPNFEILTTLINSGADPAILGAGPPAGRGYGMNAFHIAATQRNRDLCKFLLDKFPQLLNSRDFLEGTALQRAAQKDDLEMVQYLLSLGADKHTKDIDGYTPLEYVKLSVEVDGKEKHPHMAEIMKLLE